MKSTLSTDDNNQLQQRITVLEDEVESQKIEIEHWKHLYLSSLARLYGKKSEVAQKEQLNLFDEAELENSLDAIEHSEDEVTVQTIKSYTRRINKNRTLSVDATTPIVEIEHPSSTYVCSCGSEMDRVGSFSRDALALIPATKVIVRHQYPQFRCSNCLGEEKEEHTLTVAQDSSVLKGTICEPSLLSSIVSDKMAYGLPLYRQQQRFSQLGVELSRQVMSGWMMGAARELSPLKEALEREIRRCSLWNVDETTLQVLRVPEEKASQNCFMAVRVGTYRDGSKGPILFDYLENRTNDALATLLQDFDQVVQSDGLYGYSNAAKGGEFTHLGCHVHARRKFADILKVQKRHKHASEAIELYGTFFHHEKELLEVQKGEHPLEEREYLMQRRKILGPDLEAIYSWLVSVQQVAIPKTPLYSAITYALKRWEELNRFLDHPHATSSNNRAENAIRPFVLARKGFLFANTPQGAQASALYFSLTESCKAMGVDIHRYLTYVFANAGGCATESDWDAMLPSQANLSEIEDYFNTLTKAKVDPNRSEPYILRGKRY